jgi:hypothetical protein
MLPRQQAIHLNWEPHRDEIKTIYMDNDMSLKDVISLMKAKHNFEAR